jgi:hypothetical protein
MAKGKANYSPEIADAICEEMATTDHALHRICEQGMPDHATVYRWLASNQEFCDKYARVNERQADVLAGQILEISDDGFARRHSTYRHVAPFVPDRARSR